MRRHPLQLKFALQTLPDVGGLLPMREALIAASRTDLENYWAESGEYATLDRRVADLDELEAQLPSIIERTMEQIERMYRHALLSMRALERGDWGEAARELVHSGEVAEAARLLEEAGRYYARAVELGRKPRDRQVEGLAHRRLGRVARARGDWMRALDEYRSGLEIAEAVGDAAGAVVACQGLGNIHVDQGRWAKAREWYLRGVETLQDQSSSVFLHLCNAMSVVERRLGRLEDSERWLLRGEAVAAQMTDDPVIGYVEHGRARLLIAQQQWREAETLLKRTLSRKLDPDARISSLLSLADLAQEQDRAAEAERLVREAEELAIVHSVFPYLPSVYRALGRLAQRRLDPDGFVFFEQALSLIRAESLPPAEEAAALLDYARYEITLGELEPARVRLELASEIFRSIGAELETREVMVELDRLGDDSRRDGS